MEQHYNILRLDILKQEFAPIENGPLLEKDVDIPDDTGYVFNGYIRSLFYKPSIINEEQAKKILAKCCLDILEVDYERIKSLRDFLLKEIG